MATIFWWWPMPTQSDKAWQRITLNIYQSGVLPTSVTLSWIWILETPKVPILITAILMNWLFLLPMICHTQATFRQMFLNCNLLSASDLSAFHMHSNQVFNLNDTRAIERPSVKRMLSSKSSLWQQEDWKSSKAERGVKMFPRNPISLSQSCPWPWITH